MLPVALATCGICLSSPGNVELWCSHTFCASCLDSADHHGHRNCPVCRVPHLLSTSDLHRNSKVLRESYQNWRRGNAVGNKGEFADVSGYPGWRMGVLHPPVRQTLHSALCGLLFKFDERKTDLSTARFVDQPIKPPFGESQIIMDGAAKGSDADINENTLGTVAKVASEKSDTQVDAPNEKSRKQKRNILFITADQVSLIGSPSMTWRVPFPIVTPHTIDLTLRLRVRARSGEGTA